MIQLVNRHYVSFLGEVLCQSVNSCDAKDFQMPENWDQKLVLVENNVNYNCTLLFQNTTDGTLILFEDRDDVVTVYHNVYFLHATGPYPCCLEKGIVVSCGAIQYANVTD